MSTEFEDQERPGRRCSICSLDWPLNDDYKVCPSCMEPTDECSNVEPMTEDEAVSLKIQFDFERFYEEWDETHPPERLEPDANKKYKAERK